MFLTQGLKAMEIEMVIMMAEKITGGVREAQEIDSISLHMYMTC